MAGRHISQSSRHDERTSFMNTVRGDAERVQVVVVGGGPTGLTVANLLGTMGISVLLVEKHASTSNEAKAISLDDESLRTLQLAGLDQMVYPIIVPGTGTRYYSASGKLLLHARGAGARRLGHPFKNPFAQPDFERVLASGLARHRDVTVEFGSTVTGMYQDADGVHVEVETADGRAASIAADYVLGCDGGRSTVRELAGISMTGTSFPELWLVADTLEDQHDERYGMHVGDPRRPHVIVPGRDGRCRYEFKLRPDEAAPGPNPPFELVRELVSQYRDLTPQQLERSVVYGFHAVVADRFRVNRCFVLGDAAHMMPPFAGQGLNSGIRDAVNLAWKLAAVLAGNADQSLLATYEKERRPHAQATVDLSVRLGRIVMTSSKMRARLRDALVTVAMHVPWTRRYLVEMRYRPDPRFKTGFLVPGDSTQAKSLVGRALEQPLVLGGLESSAVRLDDVLGQGAAIVGVDLDEEEWSRVEKSDFSPLAPTFVDVTLGDRAPKVHPGRAGIADLDGTLQSMLEPFRGHLLLVRPDRVVAAVFTVGGIGDVTDFLHRFAATTSDSSTPSNPVTTTDKAS